MVGSASMLAGFKQMAVAVVVFITGRLVCLWLGVGSARPTAGAANDLGLIPPLMLAVAVLETESRGIYSKLVLYHCTHCILNMMERTQPPNPAGPNCVHSTHSHHIHALEQSWTSMIIAGSTFFSLSGFAQNPSVVSVDGRQEEKYLKQTPRTKIFDL